MIQTQLNLKRIVEHFKLGISILANNEREEQPEQKQKDEDKGKESI